MTYDVKRWCDDFLSDLTSDVADHAAGNASLSPAHS